MALDLNNLPLLLTLEDVAELYRCSPGTIRRKIARDPLWLRPVDHEVHNRMLFKASGVLARLGVAPADPPAAVALTPEALDEAAEQAAMDVRRRASDRKRRADAKREATWNSLTTKAARDWIGITCMVNRKVRVEVNDDRLFRIRMVFQPRFRPEGWPEVIAIPPDGPEWVDLADADVRSKMQKEIDSVMARYEPRWQEMVEQARRARKRAK